MNINIMKAIIESKIRSLTAKEGISEFEKQLFQNGVLEFDPNLVAEYLQHYENMFQDHIRWHARHTNPSIRSCAMESGFGTFVKAHLMVHWHKSFAGLVPASWNIWYNVKNDQQNAKLAGVTLSENLVTAGAIHPHWITMKETCMGQKLTVDQLAWAFTLPIATGSIEDIISAQSKMGTSQATIKAAQEKGERMRAELWGIYEKLYHRRLPNDTTRASFLFDVQNMSQLMLPSGEK